MEIECTNKKTNELYDLMTSCASSFYESMEGDTIMTCNVEGLIECLSGEGYRRSSDVAEEIFKEIFALCDNAEEKLDILFSEKDNYRRGYENSVKHFRNNMDKLRKKYIKE